MKSMKIMRHNLAIRFTHWTTAIAIFILFFSGFGQMPIYNRYFVDQIPGLAWSSDFIITLNIHYIAAVVLIFISTYYITYVLYNRTWDLIPKKGDMKESLLIILASIGLAKEPANDKYLAEQRLAFAVTALSIFALIISGLIKLYKNLPGNYLSSEIVFWTAQVHNLFTVILLISVIFHLLAFLMKNNRPLFASMFNGKIDIEYVKSRHSKWYVKLNNPNASKEMKANKQVSL